MTPHVHNSGLNIVAGVRMVKPACGPRNLSVDDSPLSAPSCMEEATALL